MYSLQLLKCTTGLKASRLFLEYAWVKGSTGHPPPKCWRVLAWRRGGSHRRSQPPAGVAVSSCAGDHEWPVHLAPLAQTQGTKCCSFSGAKVGRRRLRLCLNRICQFCLKQNGIQRAASCPRPASVPGASFKF